MKKSIYFKPEMKVYEIEIEGVLLSYSNQLGDTGEVEDGEGSKSSATYRQNLWD